MRLDDWCTGPEQDNTKFFKQTMVQTSKPQEQLFLINVTLVFKNLLVIEKKASVLRNSKPQIWQHTSALLGSH